MSRKADILPALVNTTLYCAQSSKPHFCQPLSVNYKSTTMMMLPWKSQQRGILKLSKYRRSALGEGVLSVLESKQNLQTAVQSCVSLQGCDCTRGSAAQGEDAACPNGDLLRSATTFFRDLCGLWGFPFAIPLRRHLGPPQNWRG